MLGRGASRPWVLPGPAIVAAAAAAVVVEMEVMISPRGRVRMAAKERRQEPRVFIFPPGWGILWGFVLEFGFGFGLRFILETQPELVNIEKALVGIQGESETPVGVVRPRAPHHWEVLDLDRDLGLLLHLWLPFRPAMGSNGNRRGPVRTADTISKARTGRH